MLLETPNLNDYAKECIGDQVNKPWTKDGRALNDMLPCSIGTTAPDKNDLGAPDSRDNYRGRGK